MVREGAKQAEVVPGQWTQLKVTAMELGLKPGDRLPGLKLSQFGGIVYWDDVVLVGKCDPATDPLESFIAWRKVLGTNIPPELPGELNGLIQAGPDKVLSADESVKLRRFYVGLIARPVNDELAAARTAWDAARVARIVADETAPGTFIFKDTDRPRESFVMLRGQYDKKGDPVEPAVPAALPAIAKASPEARLNRLDLAKWLVAPHDTH